MLNQQSTREWRHGIRLAALALVAGLVLPAALDAQAPMPTPAAFQQAAAQTGPTLDITMDDAVRMAMETNLGLKIQRLELDIAAQSIAGARAAFLPTTSSNFSRNTSSSPAQRNPDGTTAVTSTTTLSTQASFQQVLPWYGSSYTVNWSANRREAPGSFASFNPSLASSFNFNFNQPLWRGFLTDNNRAGLESTQRQQVITDLQLQQTIVSTEAQVKLAYLDLIANREGLKVSQQNLELDQQALENARARVKVGVSPQTDIIANEAAVATSRVQAIAAEARIAAAEDNLRRLILDPARPDYWTVSLVPTDTIELSASEVDLNAAITNALANRLDMIIAKRSLELGDLNIRVSKDSTRPDLSLNVDYRASSSGGQSTNPGDPSRGFGSVLGEAFGGTYPSWQTSVQFRYPLGRSAAEASLARLQIQRQQDVMTIRDLELRIVQQVRDAARNVQNSFRQVEAARTALDASQQNLDAENRKFGVGLSTNLDLQFRQQQLAQARLSELSARIAYNRALILFERVQRVQ